MVSFSKTLGLLNVFWWFKHGSLARNAKIRSSRQSKTNLENDETIGFGIYFQLDVDGFTMDKMHQHSINITTQFGK